METSTILRPSPRSMRFVLPSMLMGALIISTSALASPKAAPTATKAETEKPAASPKAAPTATKAEPAKPAAAEPSQTAVSPKTAKASKKTAARKVDVKAGVATKSAAKPKATSTAKKTSKNASPAPSEDSAAAAPAIVPRLALPATPAQTPPRDCNLLTEEAPRGGQLEVQGQKFGDSPVVRVGAAVTRILRRERDKISVQIPRDSNGGAVTVQVAGQKQDCGSLKIIGKNRD